MNERFVRSVGALMLFATFFFMPGGSRAAGVPAGVRGEICPAGVGGFGEPNPWGAEAISWWRGEWDAVKELVPLEVPARLTEVCLCLNGNTLTPQPYEFNIVVFAADGPDGKPGTRLLSLPFQAELNRYTNDFFQFDLSGAGPTVSERVYVGVHSVTNGPLDERQIFLCQYPRGSVTAPTFYRLPDWSGSVWNQHWYSQIGEVPHVGIRATFDTSAAAPACSTSANRACLGNGRFQVEATYDGGAGNVGDARVGTMGDDTGFLTFFREGNVEALVKVLDGCSVNGHHWVFIGGLTDVGVTVTVTDTETGHSKSYSNPRGRAFLPVQDTSALPCS